MIEYSESEANVRVVSFEINPGTLAQSKAYQAMTAAQRGVLLSLLCHIWESSNQYRIAFYVSEIARQINASAAELERLIDLCETDPSALLLRDLSILDGQIYLQAPILKQRVDTIRNAQEQALQAKEQKRLALHYKDARAARSGTRALAGTPRRDEVFVAPADRSLGRYEGLLPTKQFEASGQCFRVLPEFIVMLGAEFPEVDIDSVLRSIFDYLKEEPAKRRTHADMGHLIYTRVAAHDARLKASRSALCSLDAQLDHLIAERKQVRA